MPNIRVIQSPYIGPFANVEAVFENPSPTGPLFANVGIVGIHQGELGGRVELTQTGSGTKEYQKVQLDSGAVAAAASGAPTTGELVYWKATGLGGATGKSQYIVTNDSRFAVGGQVTGGTAPFRNEVAGILVTPQATLTANVGIAGNIWIQQKGNNTVVKTTSTTWNAGDVLVSDTSTTAAQGAVVAAGTAPTIQSLGKFAATVTVAATTATVDLDIPGIP